MDTPAKTHYYHNPRNGEPAFPCNNERPKGNDTTSVLDNVTCPACTIALVHGAVTALNRQDA